MTSVLVNGTGTIGEPLIALLLSTKKNLGIDELFFYKHTARLTDRPMIENLQKKGGKMCVDKNKLKEFRNLDIEPDMTFDETLKKIDVIADATAEGVGRYNKEKHYKKIEERAVGFLAQGSESGFGIIYANNVNDNIFEKNKYPKYVQIASCNTHAAASTIKHFAFNSDDNNNLLHANLTFLRRASDVSQERGVMAPTISNYTHDRFGTHHAEDVHKLFMTKGFDLDVFSSAIKVNSQYMHTLFSHLILEKETTKEELLNKIYETNELAITNKTAVNLVFSFGRDHGHFGRILNQAVIVEPSIKVNGKHIYYWSFTPQDGNALLSSVKAIMYWLHGKEEVENKMEYVNPWLFEEV